MESVYGDLDGCLLRAREEFERNVFHPTKTQFFLKNLLHLAFRENSLRFEVYSTYDGLGRYEVSIDLLY